MKALNGPNWSRAGQVRSLQVLLVICLMFYIPQQQTEAGSQPAPDPTIQEEDAGANPVVEDSPAAVVEPPVPVEEAGSQPVAVVEEEDEDESEEEDGDGDQGDFHSPRPSLFTQGWREERDRNLSDEDGENQGDFHSPCPSLFTQGWRVERDRNRSDSVSSDSSQSITSRMLAMLDAGPGHVKKN